ncbi:hypothetical protein Ahy_B01g055206 isoform C [Arachis hypogaea]|uniref:Uncharacterized protein n=1 Tax=Arachis hypogaea TaxID=3818 RepID=A0A445AVG0_ARAHY|nr:hypothetical protein Ahy_B01g055206 isoform C [Arachis hypogaea]
MTFPKGIGSFKKNYFLTCIYLYFYHQNSKANCFVLRALKTLDFKQKSLPKYSLGCSLWISPEASFI